MGDGRDDSDETLRTESSPGPRPSQRDLSTFRAPAQRFTLGDELGRGGMGQVIAARDVSLRRGVAIKRVLSTDDVDLDRFDREVRITAELEHPSIVPIHDVGLDDEGRPFYVMRQIRGEPLSSRLANLATLRARLALLANVLAATDAAAFAHARGIIHRDIKPANILLGAFGETLLIDWGLARRLDDDQEVVDPARSMPGEQLTVAGYVYGTPGYMPPEQARGEAVDARADVFALGATIFHILVGRGPFEGMSAAERMEAAINEQPPPIDRLSEDVPSELRAIVIKAMANDRGQRYANAGELAADLRAFLEGQLVGAHRYTVGERFRRFVRRNRAVVIIATLAVVGGAIALVRVIDERNETRIAEASARLANENTKEREDRIIVEQASLLAEIEPARAIAKLRHLPPRSPYFARARDIAAKAAARGVAHGDRKHLAPITGLGISPDGALLASVDARGHVVVRVLATQNVVFDQQLSATSHVQWLDNRRFTTNAGDGVALIDVPARSAQVLADVRFGSLVTAPDADHLRFVAAKEDLYVEQTVSTGERRVLARDVKLVHQRDHHVLVSGTSGLRWLLPDREIPLTPKQPFVTVNVALSADGRRVALATGDEVIEWDDTGAELGRWAVKFPLRPVYTPQKAPLVQTLRNTMTRLSKEISDVVVQRTRIVGAAETKLGVAVVHESGQVAFFDQAGMRTLSLGFAQTGQIAGSPTSTVLAIGAMTGEVRWWDLAGFVPRVIEIGEGRVCHVTAEMTYLINLDEELIEIERASGRRRLVGPIPGTAMPNCGSMLDNGKLAIGTAIYNGTIDVRTGEVRRLTNGPMVVDPKRRAVFVTHDRELRELPEGLGKGTVEWTAPAKITALQIAGHWLLSSLEGGALVRRDLDTGEVLPITNVPTTETLPLPDGDVLYATRRWLWRWSPAGTRLIGELPFPVLELGGNGKPAWVKLADTSTWLVDANSQLRLVTNVPRLAVSEHDHAVFYTQDGVMKMPLATEERIEYALPANPFTSRLSLDRRFLSVVVTPGFLLTFTDEVPSDPDKFGAWLDAATNAKLDQRSDVLTWGP